ncbi:SMC family ATPase [Clostridium sp. C8-1-8]|uniref:AAA family ATPase n=1 Tax=Clostridium sp. C8-1-8 TaxID=2698831 RepID=UPI001370AB8E|nr:SMC family ATPase [Clostridium sp. C8-1-8]
MKIEKLRIKNFRIFNGEYTFNLSDIKLLIIQGNNGHGKSTIFDAIEWCLLGEISRYKGSVEPSKFNYLINSDLVKYNNAKMQVELVLANDKERHTIIRTLNKSSTNTRGECKVKVDNKEVGVREGNKIIQQILIDVIDDDMQSNPINQDKIFKEFFVSTQILSQEVVSEFVLSKAPGDRFRVMESILGLKKYGDEFRRYINQLLADKKEIIQVEAAMSDSLQHKIDNLNNMDFKLSAEIESKESYVKEVLVIDEVQIIEKFNENIKKYNLIEENKELHLWVNSYLDNGFKEELINARKYIKNRLDDIYKKLAILNKSESLYEEDVVIINNKTKEIKQLIQIKSNEIQSNEEKLSQIKLLYQGLLKANNYNKIYNDELKLLNELEKNIEILKDKKNKILAIPEILHVIDVFGSINRFKDWLKDMDIKVLEVKRALHLKTKESEYRKCINNIDSIKKTISELAKEKKVVEDDIQVNSSRLINIVKSIDESENDSINQIIYNVQQYILNNNYDKCVVCGSSFKDNIELKDAIRLKIYEAISEVDNLNETKLQINSDILQAEKRLRVLNSQIEKNMDLLNKESYLERVILSDIEISKSTLNPDLLKSDIETLEESESNYIKAIEECSKSFNIVEQLESLEEKITILDKQIINKSYKLNDIKNEVKDFQKYLNQNNSVLEKDINLTELNIKKIEFEVKSLNDEYLDINSKLKQINKQKEVQEEKTSYIKKLMPEFLGTKEDIKKLSISLNHNEQILNEINAELEALSRTLECNFLQVSVSELRSDYKGIVNQIKEAKAKKKIIIDGIQEKQQYISDLQKIENESKLIQSKLMGDYMNHYNEIIDRLFFEISPHAFARHVNLITKTGNLFIILSKDKIDRDELIKLDENKLYQLVNASLTLSSAQSNILAVCIFIALNITQRWTKLKVLGIDDPFQNMDDVNAYSFIDTITNILSDRQVIVSTHSDEFAALIENKANLNFEEIGFIRLDSYNKNTVDIVSNVLVK